MYPPSVVYQFRKVFLSFCQKHMGISAGNIHAFVPYPVPD